MPSRQPRQKKQKSTSTKTLAPNPITERKRASKNSKPLKQIFKGKYITSVGQFSNCGRLLGPAEIASYVTNHGGVYEKEVTSRTTHVICSIEEYKKKGSQVKAAWALGKGRCSIVVFDWLLDCTVSNKKSCRAAGGYTLDRTIRRIQQGKKDHIAYRKRFEEGGQASKEMADTRLWHIYYDHTGFEYKVMLTRINLGANSDKPLVEKYTLYLFESNAFPHLYMCGAKLSRTHRPQAFYRENCHPMEFHSAFRHFQHFFREKTGLEWDLRLERRLSPSSTPNTSFQLSTPGPTPAKRKGKGKGKEGENGMGEEGDGKIGKAVGVLGMEVKIERKFTWTPPVLGRPVGALPYGYVRPEDRVDTQSKTDSSSTNSGSDSNAKSSSNTNTNTDASNSNTDNNTSDDTGNTCGESGTDASANETKGAEDDVVYDTDSEVGSDVETEESEDEEAESESEDDEDRVLANMRDERGFQMGRGMLGRGEMPRENMEVQVSDRSVEMDVALARSLAGGPNGRRRVEAEVVVLSD